MVSFSNKIAAGFTVPSASSRVTEGIFQNGSVDSFHEAQQSVEAARVLLFP